jgi:hypothetical protein
MNLLTPLIFALLHYFSYKDDRLQLVVPLVADAIHDYLSGAKLPRFPFRFSRKVIVSYRDDPELHTEIERWLKKNGVVLEDAGVEHRHGTISIYAIGMTTSKRKKFKINGIAFKVECSSLPQKDEKSDPSYLFWFPRSCTEDAIRGIFRKIKESGKNLDKNRLETYHATFPNYRTKEDNKDPATWVRSYVPIEQDLRYLVLKPSEYKGTVERVKYFLSDEAKEEFRRQNRRWKMTIVLYGGKGTGKTTLVRTLASHFDLPLYTVSSSDINHDDSYKDFDKLQNRIGTMQDGAPYILCFDDLDRGIDQWNFRRGPLKSIFMGMLDGLTVVHGRITFITTNDKDFFKKIEGFSRAGRIDHWEELTDFDREQIERFAVQFYGTDSVLGHFVDIDYPHQAGASLVAHFSRFNDDPQRAIAMLDERLKLKATEDKEEKKIDPVIAECDKKLQQYDKDKKRYISRIKSYKKALEKGIEEAADRKRQLTQKEMTRSEARIARIDGYVAKLRERKKKHKEKMKRNRNNPLPAPKKPKPPPPQPTEEELEEMMDEAQEIHQECELQETLDIETESEDENEEEFTQDSTLESSPLASLSEDEASSEQEDT